MRKIVLVAAIVVLTGCSYKADSTPQIPLRGINMEWDRGKDYDVMGDTEGQGCTLSILSEWLSIRLRAVGLLEGASKAGSFSNLPVGSGGSAGPLAVLFGGGPEPFTATTIATYNAIEAFKGADFALPVRSISEKKDYLLWWRECSTVTAKAVKVKR